MSGRFVRQSKFRHVAGDEPKRAEDMYTSVKATTSGEGNFIKANPTFWAVAKSGGGGPLVIHPVANKTRLSISPPVLNVHTQKVLDWDFNPFNDNMIATGSDDASIAVSMIPSGGLTEDVTSAMTKVTGHTKKISILHWHPVANGILGSAAYDRTLRTWDIELGEEISKFDDFGDNIYSWEWSKNGDRILATSKDKMVRIFDPRAPAPTTAFEGHEGTKTTKGFWVPNLNWFGVIGFSRTSQRKIYIYDERKPTERLGHLDLDQSAGVLTPFFDDDNSILYTAGKGESSISYYEITNEAPYIHFLSAFRSTTPQKGVAWIPKRGVDTVRCEIARFFRLTRDAVEPLPMLVPRKGTEIFQEDIYPPCYAGIPGLTAAEYKAGQNKDPPTLDLKDLREGKIQDVARGDDAGAGSAGLVVQKSREQLEQELGEAEKVIAEQAARIKQLTEQLAKLQKRLKK